MYFIFDIEGQLVNLSNKDICIYRFDSPNAEFEANVYAQSDGVDGASYTLHRGTMAECRDFMARLGSQLLAERIEVSSTPNEKPVEPKSSGDDLPF